ncbi:mediator of rna polymerase ii transcription subunit 16 [Pyrenophora seminiperda CCB06]|uniref:Mediator of RNA polymerase II transcription subunit 16 n=1 Tax=Pyrenophora seminiperda CCB06 TaxID=1302712 RepID=A0A3M7M3V2_9PLEO|nr:mediator of rna polymerase ii transcription subunit 16 [Pyrenophora seminiperda CCB06]
MDSASYNMDVDDLFGDSEHVNITTINAMPPLKGLDGRIDELASSGCCQKISWSKNGCVAYISPDGYSVNLNIFSHDPETGKWDLGKVVPLDLPQGRDVFPLTHLSWSHLGNDLAIMDEAGRVMVFSCALALDRMQFSRADIAHPESELDDVVGMHWLAILPYSQKNLIAWSAAREENKWKWNIRQHLFNNAHHPVDGKASLIYLKRHGELKLRFQQNDNYWQEASAQLGPMLSTKEPFTHAAFASNNDNTLLLAAYDVKRRLYLYRVETIWNVPADKRSQNAGPFEKPTIQVSLIAMEDDCNPLVIANDDLNANMESTGTAAAQLTHLNFLPVTPQQDDVSLPTIQAIFCTPPNPISYDLNPQESRYSTVVKWEVHQEQKNQLHPSLDQVTSKKKSVSSVPARNTFLLKRQPDFVLHAVVLTFYPIWYDMLLAFCYSDGAIEFKKRSTMEGILPDDNTDTVTSLLQAGFIFQHSEPSLHVAFSPSHCIAVCMQLDGTTKLRSMEYSHGTLATDDEDPHHAAALAALTLQFASAANQYFSSDDIFAIVGPMSEKRKHEFVNHLFEGLQVNIDCGIDDNSTNQFILMGRSPFFVKNLSAMHLLGFEGGVNRTLSSKMAWMILNIKYITQIITAVFRLHGDPSKTNLRPEYVPPMIGTSRWTMHFMAYILNELFTLGRAVQDIPPTDLTRPVLEAKMHELNNPALLILLSAFPRSMMKMWAQPIQWVKRSAEAHAANPNTPNAPTPSPEAKKLFGPLLSAVTELPFEWRWFEVLISETQNHVRALYKQRNLSDAQRNALERDLITGKIPDVLFPAAKRLITDTLWGNTNTSNTGPQQQQQQQSASCLADKLDQAKLMFFDTTWLGLSPSKRATHWHATHVVDVCQKMIIRGTGTVTHPVLNTTGSTYNNRNRSDSMASTSNINTSAEERKRRAGAGGSGSGLLRQCTRCGACMEDVYPGLHGYTSHHAQWLIGVSKHCVCGNSWMLVEGKGKGKGEDGGKAR